MWKSFARSLPLLAALVIPLLSVSAQTAPDFIFEIRTNGGNTGPYRGRIIAPSSWNIVEDGSFGSVTATRTYSGTADDSSITLAGETTWSGPVNPGNWSFSVGYDVIIYQRGKGNGVLTGSLDGSIAISGGNNASGSIQTIPFTDDSFYGPGSVSESATKNYNIDCSATTTHAVPAYIPASTITKLIRGGLDSATLADSIRPS